MRLVLIACCLLAVGGATATAFAGEAAARRVIGFSPDGARFAFEEFGAGDPGMGHVSVHSSITIVDAASNEISDDSVNASLDGGDETLLAPLRRLTAQAAAETLKSDRIGAPGRLIGADASSRPGEQFFYGEVWKVEAAAKATLDVQAAEIGGKAKIVLDYDRPAPIAGQQGEPSSATPPTFVVTLVKPDGRRIALTGAVADPGAKERRDFYKYAIAEAYLMPRKGKTPVIAILVETFTQGGEGDNRNFIPVAVALPAP